MAERPQKSCGAVAECRTYGEYYRKIQKHPCYDPKAAHRFGRMHLPVAPRCNIQCNYCIREFDCVNESRPGVASQVLRPKEALSKVKEVIEAHPNISVIGIAGPGDPLSNEETFATFSLIRKEYPDITFCLSTNGLLLPESVETLRDLKVGHVTITINTLDPRTGAKIYSHVDYLGAILRGERGANTLIDNQVRGIALAVESGLVVKINTVMIPSINDEDIVDISRKAKDLGAYVHNVMPLIAQHKFAHIHPPSKDELNALRSKCEEHIRQMRHCRQCRADAVGKLHEESTVGTMCRLGNEP